MSAPNTYLQKTKRRIIPTFRFYFWRIPFRFSELCQQRHTRNQPGNQRTRNPLEETWNWNWTRNPLNSKFSQSLLSSAQSRPVTDKALEDNFHMRRGGYKEKIAALSRNIWDVTNKSSLAYDDMVTQKEQNDVKLSAYMHISCQCFSENDARNENGSIT